MVTPDEPQYAAVMRGETVPPEPVNAKPRKVEAAVTAPAWATPGACGRQPGAVGRARRRPLRPPRRRPPPRPRPSATPAWLNG